MTGMALLMLTLAPGGLHQAQHRVQTVAAGVVDQRIALRVTELEPQAQPGLAVLGGGDQVLAGDQAIGSLLGLVIALVAAALTARAG